VAAISSWWLVCGGGIVAVFNRLLQVSRLRKVDEKGRRVLREVTTKIRLWVTSAKETSSLCMPRGERERGWGRNLRRTRQKVLKERGAGEKWGMPLRCDQKVEPAPRKREALMMSGENASLGRSEAYDLKTRSQLTSKNL